MKHTQTSESLKHDFPAPLSTLHKFIWPLCLVGLSILLFYPLTSMTFPILDAPSILFQAIKFSPVEFLFTPEIYQLMSPYNFTPGSTLSWQVDYKFFGLSPRPYFIHQIISAIIFIVLFYALALKISKARWIAFLCTLCFLLTPAYLDVVTYLATRHYIEGGICALLSILFYIKYLEKRSGWALGLSVLSFFVAIMFKEIYTPLPAILFFIKLDKVDWTTLWHRCLLMIPYAVVCIIYIAWRFYLLGGFGGYPTDELHHHLQSDLMGTKPKLPSAAFFFVGVKKILVTVCGGEKTQAIGIILLLSASSLLILRQQRLAGEKKIKWGSVGLVMSILFASMLPVYFLWDTMSIMINYLGRWLLIPTIGVFIFATWALGKLDRFPQIVAAIILACLYIPKGVDLISDPNNIKHLQTSQLGNKIYESVGSPTLPGAIYFKTEPSIFSIEFFSVWANVKKLHNGQWGTMPIMEPVQFLFHDISPLYDAYLRPLKSSPVDTLQWTREPTLKNIEHNPENQTYDFTFESGDHSGKLYIYLFSDTQSLVFPLGNIEPNSHPEWNVSDAFLKRRMFKSGLTPDGTQVAAWIKSPMSEAPASDTHEYIVSEGKLLSEMVDINALKPRW